MQQSGDRKSDRCSCSFSLLMSAPSLVVSLASQYTRLAALCGMQSFCTATGTSCTSRTASATASALSLKGLPRELGLLKCGVRGRACCRYEKSCFNYEPVEMFRKFMMTCSGPFLGLTQYGYLLVCNTHVTLAWMTRSAAGGARDTHAGTLEGLQICLILWLRSCCCSSASRPGLGLFLWLCTSSVYYTAHYQLLMQYLPRYAYGGTSHTRTATRPLL